MEIQLIKGKFQKNDAIEIIHRFIHVKIQYHENKIGKSDNEEDIKMRETRIKELQNELSTLKNDSNSFSDLIDLDCMVRIH